MMGQAKLADFAGTISELHEDHKRILEAVERSREAAAYYQNDAASQRHALRVLKGQLVREHQAGLFRVNSGRFVVLRQLIYEHFRDDVFPGWDCDRHVDGVYYRDSFTKAQAKPWGAHLGESTYRRRLNELADKRLTNPPLLGWKRPGYYVLAKILEGQR
jgi:hypothetical protein